MGPFTSVSKLFNDRRVDLRLTLTERPAFRAVALDEKWSQCTILTCGRNRAMGELHDHMRVIIAEIDWPKWLGEEPASEQELLALLKPCPDAR
jgi:putative SOS response-associated peptidase YedK